MAQRQGSRFALASAALAFVALQACVGDDPVLTPSGSSGSGGSSGSAAPPDQLTPCEGAVACPRFVFVTGKLHSGNLGGISGADALCQEAAKQSSAEPVRQRTFLAWLGTNDSSPSDRLTNGTRAYRRVDGVTVAANFAELTAGRLEAPLDRDESGREVGGFVWTGTESNGSGTTHECGVWETNSGAALVGNAASTDGKWASGTNLDCAMNARLYCFEL